jgi:single-stranded-DNA-specific exonuclease
VLLRFGGHAMAAGLTMREDALPVFVDAFEAAVRELADPACFALVVETDGPLAPEELSVATLAELDHEVWGQGFPAPLFADRFAVISQRLVKDRHLKLELRLGTRRVSAIAFGRTEPVGDEALIAYRLQRDDWRGESGVSLIATHIAPLEPRST